MKKYLYALCTAATLMAVSSSAQNSTPYENNMKATIALFDSVKSIDDYQHIANTFERIAGVETTKWLPSYYAGLSYVYMSFGRGLEKEARDAYLDLAEKHAEKAASLSADNVEIVVLEGYIKMARLTVNPIVRGATMSRAVSALFERALAMDPSNPRANLMHGRWKIGSAQFFGSSTDEACALVESSIPLFEAEDQDSIEPHWGLNQAIAVSKNCKAK
jgi:hypothetical protein